jgi:16S rRNA processing protein RimM
VTDRSIAETLRGRELRVLADDAPEGWEPTDPSTLLGYEVSDEERGFIGRIDSIIETGANDVWSILDGPFGQVLVPVIDDVILDIDEDSRTCLVRLLPGLIED